MNDRFLRIAGAHVANNLVNLPHLIFEVTDLCNLNCKYCGYGDLYEGYDSRSRGNLSLEKACNIIDYLAKIWKENIESSLIQPLTISFYGGEPLINIDGIKKIIRYVESSNILGKNIRYNMTTNGLLLDRYMDYLVSKEFSLLVSLDGNERDHSYRVNRVGRNSHKVVVENLQHLQQKYPDYFVKHVNFNTVLHNMNSVTSAWYFIKNTFGKETKISPLNNSGIRKEKKREFINLFQTIESSIERTIKREEFESELFIEAPITKRLISFFYRFSGNMFDNYSNLLLDSNEMMLTPTGTCTPFFKKMFITVNGKVLPCEKVNHKFAFGKATNDIVYLDYEHIAEMYNEYVFKFIGQCSTCAYSRRCLQCVFQNDEINSYNPRCNSYTTNIAFRKKIETDLESLSISPDLYEKIMKNVKIRN
jgi:uncharacterized protein